MSTASQQDQQSSVVQLAAQLLNTGSGSATQNVIYISADATYNKLALQLALTSGTVSLTPGTIPDPMSPPTTGTTIYLDLSQLQLSSSAWTALQVDDTNWTSKKFPSEGVIGITPASGSSLTLGTGPSGTLGIEIMGIVVPTELSSPPTQLDLSYYGIPTLDGEYFSIPVAFQYAPSGKGQNLAQAIAASVNGGAIVNSIAPLLMAANQFSLRLSSTSNVQVPAGPSTVFTVAFVYGQPKDPYGYGALTDLTDAGKITLDAGLNAAPWDIQQNVSLQAVTWTLQPPDGAPIVGTGEQSIVEFDFSNVVTPYQPGPTLMLVQYTGVPGYEDGMFTIVLEKVAHAQIKSLQIAPNPTYFGPGGASPQVTVSWVTSGAKTLDLTQNYQTTTVTGLPSIGATLSTETTAFTLKATGAAGSVENTDSLTVTAIALPVINSFTAMPTEIYSGSLSHDVTCAWAVDSNTGVTLNSTGNAFSGQTMPATSSTTAEIRQPQMVTLAPITTVNPLTLTRRLVFSAFTPSSKSYSLSFTPTAVAASPSGPFLLLAGPGNSLTVADTIQYSTSSTVNVGHPPTSIAFCADGSEVATTSSDQTVSILAVTLGSNGLPQFGSPATISLSGVPQQLIFSPNGPRIFVTVDGGADKRGQLVSLLKSAGSYQIEASFTVGIQPRGLTLDASGARLFVANSGDDTVTILGLSKSGAPAGTSLIHQVTGGPTGIAATPSGQQLLVSCATAGNVLVIDPNYPDTGQRNPVVVGKSPGSIAITPTGAYAFVVNTGDGTVSLLDCWGLPSNASALGGPIQMGTGASAVAMSPEGLQVLVAQANGFSVITLATYHTPTQAPSVPNHPTSVAVVPDGSVAFVWHDASLPAIAPSPGILSYTTDSGVISNVLASSNVLRCVTSPAVGAKQALAIVLGDPTLHLIDTDTLTTSAVPLQVPTGTVPVSLEISGEGNTAFIVVTDASKALALLVFELANNAWTPTQTLPLYTATSTGRILLRCTPDATSLFLVDVVAATVRVIKQSAQVYTLSPTIIQGDVQAVDIAVLPDGSTAYVLNTGQSNNTITVVDVASLSAHVAALPQQYVNLTGIQPAPDGRRLFATDANAAALRVIDPQSLRIVQTISLLGPSLQASGAAGLAVMPDASQIFVANTFSQTLSIVEQVQMGTSSKLEAAVARPGHRRRRGTVLEDDSYSGLFMRHYLGDSPGAAPNGWSASPDVIAYGASIQKDLTQFTSPTGYQNPFGSTIYTAPPPGFNNYIYIRGLNTTSAQITSRAYFYYTPGGLALWPGNWISDGVTVAGKAQNWVDITAPPPSDPTTNGVGVCAVPLIWSATPVPPGSDHYCMTVWVVNGPNPQPPNWKSYSSFATLQDLANFIVSNPNMAWRNTVDVPTPPPDYTYNTGLALGVGGGTVQVSVVFSNVPSDGTFAVNMQGSSPNNSIVIPQSSLQNYQGGYQSPFLNFPSSFATSVQVQHWPGKTPLPANAKINVTCFVPVPPSFARTVQLICKRRHVRTPLRRVGNTDVFIIGSTIYNLLYQSQGRPLEGVR